LAVTLAFLHNGTERLPILRAADETPPHAERKRGRQGLLSGGEDASMKPTIAPGPAARAENERTQGAGLAGRVTGVDAFRGFTMLAMASAGLHIPEVAKKFPDCRVMQTLAYQLDHVKWTGCAAWDLIQLGFFCLAWLSQKIKLYTQS